MTSSLHSFGLGIATVNNINEIIEVYYPAPVISPPKELSAILSEILSYNAHENAFIRLDQTSIEKFHDRVSRSDLSGIAQQLEILATSRQPIIACCLSCDSTPSSVAEVFLKLHLLSHRFSLPNSLNLNGAFGILHNLAWTNKGAVELKDLAKKQLEYRCAGELLEVMSVDKFPKMANYIVPPGVRIAHTARVRLGAYLGEGTTVMHEGFVNFNAGSAGAAMIEGRISASVMVGKGSDLGGGCSIMGTLSGGGTQVISVGENSLIGANAGIGFPLGDRCIVEAGLYVTAGTKVNLLNLENKQIDSVKALELANKPDLLFRRNSLNGAVECRPNKKQIALNEDLHSND